MSKLKLLRSILIGGASVIATVHARADTFDIPSGDLQSALAAYSSRTGVELLYLDKQLEGVRTRGARGDLTAAVALSHILAGTGFTTKQEASAVTIVRYAPNVPATGLVQSTPLRLAAAAASAGIESVVVTSSKIKGDIQTVPIAITALSQEQLTARQIAGGPDLVKEVPNLTFSKTNFSGYNLEIRGIGTQAISVTTDPAVAVAFNDTPFIRNHFFEQEFFDVSQVEVLRGPQGTLYGRNATAGVVNLVSAKPTDQFEAMLSTDIGNYHNRRFEGMVNIPIVNDRLDLRVAGEWTKRDGYTFNETTGSSTDGRDLWSGRVTLGWKPVSDVQTYLIWEHFSENDDRLRSGKQLCKTDPGLSSIGNVPVDSPRQSVFDITSATFSQGCLPSSMYSKDSFEVPNGFSLPFISGAAFEGFINGQIDPYQSTTQSTNLRDIQSAIEPRYIAKNDTLEFNASWNVSPVLTLSSDTGYNNDFLWSTEDYNRFDTSPGIFVPDNGGRHEIDPVTKAFCDPQLGCSDRLVVQDLSTERAWQLSQEFRLASSFEGPLNFSVGGNYLHYETIEKYYVFSNTFTMISLNNVGCNHLYVPGVTTDSYCLSKGLVYNTKAFQAGGPGGGIPTESPQYLDPNPIGALNDDGHNYFLSKNPYVLNSYAVFGEAYYDVTNELKLTGGLRWTDDEKHFVDFPSELLTQGFGYPSSGTVDQKWNQWTGRAVANWTPKIDFTDHSMFYASYAHGYKAGGANPPGAVLLQYTDTITFPVHPLTFKPEFIDAYELGTKNTLLDGGLTLNGDVFFYNYKGYQISEIVDRTSVNLNFDATVKGAEIEATWEPLQGLKFSFAGGYEDTNIDKDQSAIDLIDRTAGTPGWIVMKPWVGQSSNCIFPTYVAAALVVRYENDGEGNAGPQACGVAYNAGLDPITQAQFSSGTYPITLSRPGYPALTYPGFDPSTAPNNGEGFAKNVGGNELPNAPHYTVSLTGDYTMPVSDNWAATLHSDFYWQSQSFARVFNDRPYDKIRGYSNVNAALILTDASGWQVMGYVKNIFDTTAITGDFLNSDDSGLTTNIFLTDPRLYGVRITKHFDDGDSPGGGFDLFSNNDADNKRPQIWLTLGGNFAMMDASQKPYVPPFSSLLVSDLPTPAEIQKTPKTGLDWDASISYQPEDSDWVLKAGIRYGRSLRKNDTHKSQPLQTRDFKYSKYGAKSTCPEVNPNPNYASFCRSAYINNFVDAKDRESERHTILDFTLGKDVGIGIFGEGSAQTISAGVRVAQFTSGNSGMFNSDPNYYFGPHSGPFTKYHDIYTAEMQEKRSFHGVGPQVTWDGSASVFGTPENGQLSLDWGLNAAVLFGRQRVNIHHQRSQCHFSHAGLQSLYTCYTVPSQSRQETIKRSRSVTVPNLGGYAGLSVQYNDAKVSFGYRADEFFGAMDGGQETAKKYNRGFFGPYLNLSLGFGG